MGCRHRLPGFRGTCLAIAAVYVLLGASVLVQGGAAAMAQYGVPEATLASAHYQDAIWWVYTHMIVLGLLIGVLGHFGRDAALRVWTSRLMLAAHLYYLWLDVTHSDSALGNGLYQGPASIVPAIVAGVVTVLWLHLSLCSAARGAGAEATSDR